MDRARPSAERSVTDLSEVREPADEDSKPEIEPDSWRELTEFTDQFDDAVFGVRADPEGGASGVWIVDCLEKLRPAAVPLGDPATFDLSVLDVSGNVVDEIRLTIEEIEHVRAAEPSDELHPEEGAE